MVLSTRRCTLVLATLASIVQPSFSTESAPVSTQNTSVRLYFGLGCFFAHQHLWIAEFEQKVLARSDSQLTAITGYAGSTKTGPHGSSCYHNSKNFSDYGALGHAEVAELDVPMDSLEKAFAVYFGAFVETDTDKWDRPDYYDQGAEYRSLVGVPGGMGNTQVLAAMKRANTKNLTFKPGQGSDADSFGTNAVYVMDSAKFAVIQAERCLQFHDDAQAKYPDSYHQLVVGFWQSGKVKATSCPPNFICNFTAVSTPELVTVAI